MHVCLLAPVVEKLSMVYALWGKLAAGMCCRPEVTLPTNFPTQIYILMTIRGHFMLSVAKVDELLALENGTTNQNGGDGVPKLSFSIIISSSRY